MAIRLVHLLCLVSLVLGCVREGAREATGVVGDHDPLAQPQIDDGEQEADELPCSETPTFVGVLVAQWSNEVTAEVEGDLLALEVRPGDRVEERQQLGVVRHPNAAEEAKQARADLRAAESALRQAEALLDRAERGVRRGEKLGDLISSEELDRLRGEKAIAEASVDEAAARVERAKSVVKQVAQRHERGTLRAPATGRVAERFVDPGAHVTENAPVLRIISDDLIVRFAIPPASLHCLEREQALRVVLPSGEELAGSISRVSPGLEPASQMIFAEGGLTELGTLPSGVYDGLRVDVQVIVW